MNIDRDDEYATRYEAAPTIEEQIAHERDAFELHAQIHGEAEPMMAAKIASLERLKRLDSQPGTVEPELVALMRRYPLGDNDVAAIDYIDALQSALKLAQEERDEYKRQSEFWKKSSTEWKESRERFMERAEKAEAELKLAQEERDDAYEVADSESKGVWSETLLRYAKFNGEHLAVCFERNEYRERAEKAESLNRRMVELMKEPVAYRYKYHAQTSADSYVWVFDQDTWNGQKPLEVQPVYVMSDELLKEVGE